MNLPAPAVTRQQGYEAQAEILAIFCEAMAAVHSLAVAQGQCDVARMCFEALCDFGESSLAPHPGTAFAFLQARRAIARGDADAARHFAVQATRYLLTPPTSPPVETPAVH